MVKGFELRVGDLGFVVSSFGLLGLLDFGPMSFGFILPAGSSVFENLVLGYYAVMEKLGDVVSDNTSFVPNRGRSRWSSLSKACTYSSPYLYNESHKAESALHQHPKEPKAGCVVAAVDPKRV